MAEINSKETLEAWLQDKPREWAAVIAHRGALRVLPIALNPGYFKDAAAHVILTGALFRAGTVSRVVGTAPIHEIVRAGPDTTLAAADAAHFAADATDGADVADAAALSAAYAAYVTYSAYVSLIGADVADAAALAVTDALYTAAYAAFAAAETAADGHIWSSIQRDCDALDGGVSPVALLSQPLWAGALPDWIEPEIRAMETYLTSLGQDFDLWIDWYRRRIIGDATGFGLPPGPEEELSRRLIEASDEWWKREPALVNGDIKAWIAELTPEPDEDAFAQNPFTENFIADEHGQIGIVPPTTPNGLIDDDDARRFHTECRGEIIGAIEVSGISQTQATDVLGPLQALLVAVGEAVGHANPQAFVSKLEKLRTLYNLRDGDADMATPFTLLQKVEISSVLKIGDAWIAFDGKLATIRDGTYGPGYPRISVEPSAVRIIIEDARSMGVARADAHQLIIDTSAEVPENAVVDDRRRITLGARFGNFIRATGRFIWTHKGKIVAGVRAAIGFINKNAVMLAEMFASSPTLVEIIKWIGKLKL